MDCSVGCNDPGPAGRQADSVGGQGNDDDKLEYLLYRLTQGDQESRDGNGTVQERTRFNQQFDTTMQQCSQSDHRTYHVRRAEWKRVGML